VNKQQYIHGKPFTALVVLRADLRRACDVVEDDHQEHCRKTTDRSGAVQQRQHWFHGQTNPAGRFHAQWPEHYLSLGEDAVFALLGFVVSLLLSAYNLVLAETSAVAKEARGMALNQM
jgi:hypothetical protein